MDNPFKKTSLLQKILEVTDHVCKHKLSFTGEQQNASEC